MPKIKSIRDIPLGKIEFETAKEANDFTDELIGRDGYFFYREKGISNPSGAFVLFRYKAKIFAFGIIKEIFNKNVNRNEFKRLQDEYLTQRQKKEYKGVYLFYPESIKLLRHPIEKYEINLLPGCSKKVFGRSPNIYIKDCNQSQKDEEFLEALSLLLNSKSNNNVWLSFNPKHEVSVRTRKPGGDTFSGVSKRKAIPPTKVRHVHEKMKQKIINELKKKYGDKFKDKVEDGRDYIDILIKNSSVKTTLIEIKTDETAEKCIRKALGQILYYNWTQEIEKKNENHETELIIYGLYKFTVEKEKFLQFIQKKFRIEIKYISFEEKYEKEFVQNLVK